MKYDTRLGKYNGKARSGGLRSTLCVSSQVGCKMGCKFCATGTMGFKSNLSTGEIVEQLVLASRVSPIRNVVFMVTTCFFFVLLNLVLRGFCNSVLLCGLGNGGTVE